MLATYDSLKTDLLKLREAAFTLYTSAKWETDDLTVAQQAYTWERLRDALKLPTGTASAVGAAADK